MASHNAKAVAKEVINNVRKGTKVNLGKIIRSKGYKRSVSLHPTTVTETKSFQDEINPVVQAMIVERDRAIRAMKGKISKAKYRDVIDAADKLTKNIQLLSGKETENKTFNISMLLDEIENEK